jgi:hypothetical protein
MIKVPENIINSIKEYGLCCINCSWGELVGMVNICRLVHPKNGFMETKPSEYCSGYKVPVEPRRVDETA